MDLHAVLRRRLQGCRGPGRRDCVFLTRLPAGVLLVQPQRAKQQEQRHCVQPLSPGQRGKQLWHLLFEAVHADAFFVREKRLRIRHLGITAEGIMQIESSKLHSAQHLLST